MGSAYWKLWSASTISSLGGGVSTVAFPLLVASLTREPTAVAGLWVAFSAPWLVFGLPAGALVDRLDRRRTMVFVNGVRAALLGVLAVAVLAEAASLPLLYAIAFLLGAGETLFDNAAQSMLPALVPRERLDEANGRLLAAERVANEFAGPPLGALLFGVSAAIPFVVDGAAFAASCLLVLAIGGAFRPERVASTLRAEIAEGLRWLRAHELLRTLAAMVAVLGLVDSAWFAILVLYAFEVLELGGLGYSALVVAGGVGSVAGSLAAPRLARWTALAVSGSAALAAVAQLVLGLTSTAAVAVVMLAVSGFAFGVWNVVNVSLRQALAPDRLLGRVHSAYRFLGVGAYALGALLGGLIAGSLGLRAPFLIGAPILLAVALVAFPVLRGAAVRV